SAAPPCGAARSSLSRSRARARSDERGPRSHNRAARRQGRTLRAHAPRRAAGHPRRARAETDRRDAKEAERVRDRQQVRRHGDPTAQTPPLGPRDPRRRDRPPGRRRTAGAGGMSAIHASVTHPNLYRKILETGHTPLEAERRIAEDPDWAAVLE